MPAHSDTIAAYLARGMAKRLDELRPPTTDMDRIMAFRDDPDGFAREILGITPWSRQREIIEAPLTHKRVATVSGHKTGKSTALAILALWFYCTRPAARVVITAATDRQVNGIIWREVRRLIRRSLVPIPGGNNVHFLARSGLDDPSDFSEIRGYTAREAEAVAGVSGAHILYLVDEASGVASEIFEAIEGNRAGGNAWVFLISNPTKADGEFYEAFHSKAITDTNPTGYLNIHIDSRESPNVTGEWEDLGDKPIAGLATPEWIDEKIRDWGEDSALFKVRVAGSFVVAEEAKVFQLAMLGEAQARWHETKPSGRLCIGVDPAGDGDGGDESALVARRGRKVTEIRARPGLSPAGHIAEVQDMIKADKGPKSPTPAVLVESEGGTGWKVYVAMKEHADRTREFELVRIRTSDKAVRQPLIYDRIRDELYANAREWMRDDGAIPEHTKLEQDLHAPEFKTNLRGRLKLTPKKDLRKTLGRSPDVGDAFTMSVWEPLSMRMADQEAAGPPPAPEHDEYVEGIFDPYGGSDPYARGL